MLQVQKRVVHKTTSIWSDQCFHWIESESAHCVVRSTAADADWRRHQCQLRHQHHNGPAWSSGASAVETEHESTWSDSCICRRPRDCTVNQYTYRHSDVISITTPGLYSESTHTHTQTQWCNQHHNGPAWSSGASVAETGHESTWPDSCICCQPRDCTANQYTHRHKHRRYHYKNNVQVSQTPSYKLKNFIGTKFYLLTGTCKNENTGVLVSSDTYLPPNHKQLINAHTQSFYRYYTGKTVLAGTPR